MHNFIAKLSLTPFRSFKTKSSFAFIYIFCQKTMATHNRKFIYLSGKYILENSNVQLSHCLTTNLVYGYFYRVFKRVLHLAKQSNKVEACMQWVSQSSDLVN